MIKTFFLLLIISILLTACSPTSQINYEATKAQGFLETVFALEAQLTAAVDEQETKTENLSSPEASTLTETEIFSDTPLAVEPNLEIATDTPVPSPGIEADMATKDRLVYCSVGDDDFLYTKLDAITFQNKINLIIDCDLANVLNVSDNKAIIYAPSELAYAEDLVAIRDFVNAGGKAFFIYDYYWTDQNQVLQDFYQVSIVKENLMWSEDAFFYPDNLLPAWLSDLQFGVADDGYTIGITAFIVPLDPGSEETRVSSMDTGKERIVYYQSADKRITFFPDIMEQFEYHVPMFSDRYIDQADNIDLLLRICQFLLAEP